MTTEQATEPTEKTADALVGRLVEATLGTMDVLTVYIGDGSGCIERSTTAVRRRPPTLPLAPGSTRAMPASGSSSRPRPGSSTSTTWRRRPMRGGSACPRRTPLPCSTATARGPSRRSPDRWPRRPGHAAAPRGVPDRWRRRVVRLRPRHDRVPGRLQSALARRLVRLGAPAGDPGDPRAARRRPAGTCRGRRLRRRMGGDRDRACLPEGARRRLRSRRVVDRARRQNARTRA